jgi:hypothetical protein
MRESSLHLALKDFYTQDGGFTEWYLDGYMIDVYKDGLLIEIQTGNFSSLKTKLESLLNHYPIRLIYPIAKEKYIVMKDPDRSFLWRRKSPKKGRIEDLFYELVFITPFIFHPNLSLEILITSEEEERLRDGRGSWRRAGISISDRRLVGILDRILFMNISDYRIFVPSTLELEFTNLELALNLSISKRLASKMTYCLANIGLLEKVGKQKNFNIFKRTWQ